MRGESNEILIKCSQLLLHQIYISPVQNISSLLMGKPSIHNYNVVYLRREVLSSNSLLALLLYFSPNDLTLYLLLFLGIYDQF